MCNTHKRDVCKLKYNFNLRKSVNTITLLKLDESISNPSIFFATVLVSAAASQFRLHSL